MSHLIRIKVIDLVQISKITKEEKELVLNLIYGMSPVALNKLYLALVGDPRRRDSILTTIKERIIFLKRIRTIKYLSNEQKEHFKALILELDGENLVMLRKDMVGAKVGVDTIMEAKNAVMDKLKGLQKKLNNALVEMNENLNKVLAEKRQVAEQGALKQAREGL